MEITSKPKVIVSRCLEFESCRYNGQKIPNNFIELLMDYVDFIPVCPEMEIGLGVPRDPIHILKKNSMYDLFQPKSNLYLTESMNQFSTDFIKSNPDIDGAIFKSKSPSCGIRGIPVYNEKGKTSEKRGGLFASAIIDSFPEVALEEEGRLNNALIREHFLTKLYTLRLFKEISKNETVKSLVQFQTENKYLFMAYNQNQMRKLGKLIANHNKNKINDLISDCRDVLHLILASVPRRKSVVNVLMHIFGYFSKELNKMEKMHFLELVEQYNNYKITLAVCNQLLVSWIKRFDQKYLAKQRFFEPFPTELMSGSQVEQRFN